MIYIYDKKIKKVIKIIKNLAYIYDVLNDKIRFLNDERRPAKTENLDIFKKLKISKYLYYLECYIYINFWNILMIN